MKKILNIVFKIMKIMLVVVLLLFMLITFLLILYKYNVFEGKSLKSSELDEVYNNMSNLKSVKITRTATSENVYSYVYSYDVLKKWGDVSYKQLGTTDEGNYYFVYDNNHYYYYHLSLHKWDSDFYERIYLDDYDYILYFLRNIKKMSKGSDGKYSIILKNRALSVYQYYYTSVYNSLSSDYSVYRTTENLYEYFMERGNNFFPRSMYSPYAFEQDNIKITLKITDDKYIDNITFDFSKACRHNCVASITYSDFNNSEVKVPTGVLAQLYQDKK